MYEFHGWFGIAESPEEGDAGSLDAGIAELRLRVAAIDWATGEVVLNVHNGEFFLLANGLMNRRRDEAADLDALLSPPVSQAPGVCSTNAAPTWTSPRGRARSASASWPGARSTSAWIRSSRPCVRSSRTDYDGSVSGSSTTSISVPPPRSAHVPACRAK